MEKSNIALFDQLLSWKQAVKAVGNLLLENGSIYPEYIDSMVRALEEFGPYIAIAPGIAIAHAKPGSEVKKEDVALIVDKKGIEFNSKNDPIHVLFAFCTTDADHHMKFISDLAGLLSDDNIVDKALECESKEDIYKLFFERRTL